MEQNLSSVVPILSGVRQGGILSPLLFSLFIDSILDVLESSGLGCFINNRCLNSFLYADDLVLLSPSVHDLQALLTLSSNSFLSLGLEINPLKSCCLRVGSRHMVKCQDLNVNGSPVAWVKETKYLGVFFKSSKCLSYNWFSARCSYYRAANSIFSSLGALPPIDVIIKLFKSICFPILTYGIASVSLSNKDIVSFTHAYNNVFMKLFKSFNVDTISFCQYYCNCLPFAALYDLLRLNFLCAKFKQDYLQASNYLDDCEYADLYKLCDKYAVSPSCSKQYAKLKVWTFVEAQLGF